VLGNDRHVVFYYWGLSLVGQNNFFSFMQLMAQFQQTQKRQYRFNQPSPAKPVLKVPKNPQHTKQPLNRQQAAYYKLNDGISTFFFLV
jgi:hypothetical protein